MFRNELFFHHLVSQRNLIREYFECKYASYERLDSYFCGLLRQKWVGHGYILFSVRIVIDKFIINSVIGLWLLQQMMAANTYHFDRVFVSCLRVWTGWRICRHINRKHKYVMLDAGCIKRESRNAHVKHFLLSIVRCWKCVRNVSQIVCVFLP